MRVKQKIAFDEVNLRQKLKEAGGRWSKSTKTWKLPYNITCKLGLKKRIVLEKE